MKNTQLSENPSTPIWWPVPGLEQVRQAWAVPRCRMAWRDGPKSAVGLVGDALQRDHLEEDVGEVGDRVGQQRLLHGGQGGYR